MDIIYFNYISGGFEYFGVIIYKNIKVQKDVVTYFNEKEHALSFMRILTNSLSAKFVSLPNEIEIVDASYGNKRIFFFDKSKVYITSIKQD